MTRLENLHTSIDEGQTAQLYFPKDLGGPSNDDELAYVWFDERIQRYQFSHRVRADEKTERKEYPSWELLLKKLAGRYRLSEKWQAM